MKDPTYQEMTERYGHKMAYGLLLLMEQSAKIKEDIAGLDENARWEKAINALDNDIMVA